MKHLVQILYKKRPLLISVLGLFSVGIANGQPLANVIAADAGGSPANYADYGESLAITLNLLTPAQLAEVFEGGIPDLDGVVGNGEEEGGYPPGYQDALDNLLSAQGAMAVASQTLMDAQDALASVLADEDGLKKDGIPGNYLAALLAAFDNLASAEAAYTVAETAVADAQAAVDGFGNVGG